MADTERNVIINVIARMQTQRAAAGDVGKKLDEVKKKGDKAGKSVETVRKKLEQVRKVKPRTPILDNMQKILDHLNMALGGTLTAVTEMFDAMRRLPGQANRLEKGFRLIWAWSKKILALLWRFAAPITAVAGVAYYFWNQWKAANKELEESLKKTKQLDENLSKFREKRAGRVFTSNDNKLNRLQFGLVTGEGDDRARDLAEQALAAAERDRDRARNMASTRDASAAEQQAILDAELRVAEAREKLHEIDQRRNQENLAAAREELSLARQMQQLQEQQAEEAKDLRARLGQLRRGERRQVEGALGQVEAGTAGRREFDLLRRFGFNTQAGRDFYASQASGVSDAQIDLLRRPPSSQENELIRRVGELMNERNVRNVEELIEVLESDESEYEQAVTDLADAFRDDRSKIVEIMTELKNEIRRLTVELESQQPNPSNAA